MLIIKHQIYEVNRNSEYWRKIWCNQTTKEKQNTWVARLWHEQWFEKFKNYMKQEITPKTRQMLQQITKTTSFPLQGIKKSECALRLQIALFCFRIMQMELRQKPTFGKLVLSEKRILHIFTFQSAEPKSEKWLVRDIIKRYDEQWCSWWNNFCHWLVWMEPPHSTATRTFKKRKWSW